MGKYDMKAIHDIIWQITLVSGTDEITGLCQCRLTDDLKYTATHTQGASKVITQVQSS